MGSGLVLVDIGPLWERHLISWGVQESAFPKKGRDCQNEKEFEGEKGRGGK